MKEKCPTEKKIKRTGKIKTIVATCREREGHPAYIAYIKHKRGRISSMSTDCAIGFEPEPGDRVAIIEDEDGLSMEKIDD